MDSAGALLAEVKKLRRGDWWKRHAPIAKVKHGRRQNSLSPTSHFWHRQVSDPSHRHMDLGALPVFWLKQKIYLLLKMKKSNNITKGIIAAVGICSQSDETTYTTQNEFLSQVISKLADITNINNLYDLIEPCRILRRHSKMWNVKAGPGKSGLQVYRWPESPSSARSCSDRLSPALLVNCSQQHKRLQTAQHSPTCLFVLLFVCYE